MLLMLHGSDTEGVGTNGGLNIVSYGHSEGGHPLPLPFGKGDLNVVSNGCPGASPLENFLNI